MVRFGHSGRPAIATEVQVAQFEGPLALLLSLIAARQLAVLSVPLGGLAAAYLDALSSLTTDRLGNVSAFVAIASQLILIKSRAMLPRPVGTDPSGDPLDDAPDPEAELRRRLLLYRAYRDAGARLAARAEAGLAMFRREATAARASAIAGARPADAAPLDPAVLAGALSRLVSISLPVAASPEVVARVVSLTERAAIIRSALRAAPTIVLQELLAGVRDRVVIAITFLAMLELMKRREIVVEQTTPWGPIVARSTTAQERAAAGLAGAMFDGQMDLDETLESFA
ncbi:MAG: segregation/condensation protein A [Chloroflexi bacterium]|nr:segregation/condensation protein A [Chloroflexota bacterium]